MDSLASLPKDPLMVMVNRTAAEWERKTKEFKRKKMLNKQQAWERGEETDSDDNDEEEEEYDEVVADIEWDDLGREDTLIGTHSSMQGPFSFHAREGAAVRPEEVGRTIGPSLGPSVGGRIYRRTQGASEGERPRPPCL